MFERPPQEKSEPEIRRERMQEAEGRAQALYGSKEVRPYHNWEHIQYILPKAEAIIERCQKDNVALDADVVRMGVLYHDAGHHENHTEKGFQTKEEYSAALMQKDLLELRYDPEFIRKVEGVILATIHDVDPKSLDNNAKAVRAADLSNTGANYADFVEATVALKREAERMSGKPMTWEGWKKGVSKIVGDYIKEDLTLTSGDQNPDGTSKFRTQAQANLARFLADPQFQDSTDRMAA